MKRSFLAGTVAVQVLIAAQGAMAQVPVVDQAVISAANQTASNTAEQLKRLNDIKKTTEDILDAIGMNGQGTYDLNKMSAWQDFAGGGELLKNLTQFAPNTNAFGTSSEGASGKGGAQEFADLQAARDFVMKSLYASKMTSAAEERDYAQMRRNLMREANVDAYALAMMARQYLAESSDRAAKLDGIVNGAEDMRADVRANTAVTLAQHQELSGMLAVMTAMLERDATAYFANEERDFFAEDGGTNVPDIYQDQDFLPDGTRIGIGGSGKQSGVGGSGGGSGNLFEGAASQGQKAVEEASSLFEGDVSQALGAAGIAAGMDGNQTVSSALKAAAQSKGDVASALFEGAASVGQASSNEQLKWMYDSADYGMSSGNFNEMIDVGSGKKPMIDVMFDVAGNMASESGVDSGILREAQRALENGEIDERRAALIALEVASDAGGHADLNGLLRGAGRMMSGADSKTVVMDVIRSTGGGSATADVVRIIQSNGW